MTIVPRPRGYSWPIWSAEYKLRESEERYRGLFDNAQETVGLRQFVYDNNSEIIDTVLVDANPAKLKAYGASSIDNVRGRRYSELHGPKEVASIAH